MEHDNDMAESLRKSQAKNPRLYDDGHKGAALAADLREKRDMLADLKRGDKVDFRGLDDVQERTERYFNACIVSQTFPSVMTLSVCAYGVSRQALNAWMSRNPDSPTTQYVQAVKDLMADVMVEESLSNNCNPIMAIFQLKNHFGHSDKTEVDVTARNANDPLYADTPEDAARIVAKYLPDDACTGDGD